MILSLFSGIRASILDYRGMLSIFSGILIALSFPLTDFAFLIWVALVPLLVAAEKSDARTAFRVGFITGITAYAGILYWLNIVFTHYGHLPWVVSVSLYLLLVLWLASFYGLSLVTASIGEKLGIKSAFTLPVAWVAFDLIRSHLLTGFPWAMLGHSQYRILPLIQIADIFGVYGITAVIVLANIVLYRVFRALSGAGVPYPVKSAAILAIFMVFILGYGFKRLNTHDNDSSPQLKVALIQGNIPQNVKWSPAFKDHTISVYERLTTEAAKGGADLVVWPESAMPFFYQDDQKMGERLRTLARNLETTILFGAPAHTFRNGRNTLLNSAFAIDRDGRTLARSDKIHLVPYGEYVPLGKYFTFINKLVSGIGDFSPGESALTMNIGKTVTGTLVCYEIIFPEIAAKYVQNGARVLINITNDAWFGRSSAPYQHLAIAAFRAVETRTPLIRAANTGVTAIIDRNGHIRTMTDIFVEDYRTGLVTPGTGDSVYLKTGDIAPWLCVLLTMLLFARQTYLRKRKGI